MKGNQEPVDDLFIKLFSYTSRDKRTPTEDFCTEALAWCLRCSDEFRSKFLAEVDQTLEVTSEVTITTQRSFKSEAEDESTNRGRFDLVIESTSSNGFAVIIEAKVDSNFGNDQIKRYYDELSEGSSFEECSLQKKLLVTLTRPSAQICETDEKYLKRKLTWSKVQGLLEEVAGKEPVTRDTLQNNFFSTNLVLRFFAEFLKSNGMHHMKIPEILKQPDLGESATFCAAVLQILREVKNSVSSSKRLFGTKEPEVRQFDEEIWIGFATNISYVGLRVKPGLEFRIEYAFDPEKEMEPTATVLQDNFKCENWEDGKSFQISGDFKKEYDGDAEKIREWFRQAAEMALKHSGTKVTIQTSISTSSPESPYQLEASRADK